MGETIKVNIELVCVITWWSVKLFHTCFVKILVIIILIILCSLSWVFDLFGF